MATLIVLTVAGAKREVQLLQKIGILARDKSLPLYLGFIELVHNVRRRGKALLGSLLSLLLT